VFVPLPDGNASFDALIAQVTHRFARGFTISTLYTFSHSIDTASYEIGFQQTDPYNQALDKASSDYDVRHHFQVSAFWELPIFRGRVLGRLDPRRSFRQTLRLSVLGFDRKLRHKQ
jgi:hypothetical protein